MKKVLGRLFWIIVVLFMCLWTFEFYLVRNGKDPMFCIRKNTHNYTDGTTEECIGLGYKVYKYNRNNLYGTEFVSMFASERLNADATRLPDLNSETTTKTTTSEDTTDTNTTEEEVN